MERVSRINDEGERVALNVPPVPALEFVDLRPDPSTGEAVLSSWWLLPEPHWSECKAVPKDVPRSEGRVVVTVRIATAQAL